MQFFPLAELLFKLRSHLNWAVYLKQCRLSTHYRSCTHDSRFDSISVLPFSLFLAEGKQWCSTAGHLRVKNPFVYSFQVPSPSLSNTLPPLLPPSAHLIFPLFELCFFNRGHEYANRYLSIQMYGYKLGTFPKTKQKKIFTFMLIIFPSAFCTVMWIPQRNKDNNHKLDKHKQSCTKKNSLALSSFIQQSVFIRHHLLFNQQSNLFHLSPAIFFCSSFYSFILFFVKCDLDKSKVKVLFKADLFYFNMGSLSRYIHIWHMRTFRSEFHTLMHYNK